MRNSQLPARDPDLLQRVEDCRRHPGRQVHRAELVKDLDATDSRRIEARFIRDGTHDVAGLHLMNMADFNPKRLHAGFRTTRSARTPRSIVAGEFPGGTKRTAASTAVFEPASVNRPTRTFPATIAGPPDFVKRLAHHFVLQQQRLTVDHHHAERCEQLSDRHVRILAPELLNDRPQRFGQRMIHALRDPLMKPRHALLVDQPV
jgi:hypothetical protein